MFKMNNNLVTYYSNLTLPSGFQLANTRMTFSGLINGYDMCIDVTNPQLPYNFTLVTNAVSTTPLSDVERQYFVKSFPSLINFNIVNSRIMLSFKKMNKQTGAQEFYNIITTLTNLLKSRGYVAVCENCGNNVPTCDYIVQGTTHKQFCDKCAQNAYNSLVAFKTTRAMKKENIPLGAVGAFIGTLLGMLVIFLIARLNMVSILGGIALGFCVILGYKLLSGKVSVVGIIISAVFIIIGVYFVNKINWVYNLSDGLKDMGYSEYTFGKVWKDFSDILKLGDGDGEYFSDLFKFYLYSGLGAVIPIITVFGSYKSKTQMQLVAGPYVAYNAPQANTQSYDASQANAQSYDVPQANTQEFNTTQNSAQNFDQYN